MMYTFGDVRTPLVSTAQIIEATVHKQLVIILVKAARIAQNVRGARSLSTEDVMFVVRRDPVKLHRLKEFLSWKDLRKNAKPSEDGSGGLDGPATGETHEDLLGMGLEAENTGHVVGGKAPTSKAGTTLKRKQARIPWDPLAAMVVEATNGEADLLDDEPVDARVSTELNRRLSQADRITRDMTREEYMEYSECRQASFTYKKAKKFREWLNAGAFIDFRLNDEVLEIFGFLAWEMVRMLTEEALTVKASKSTPETAEIRESLDRKDLSQIGRPCTLFACPTEKTALTPEHITESISRIASRSSNPLAFLLPTDCPQRESFRLY